MQVKKLNEFCEENIGFPVIYQLYEICQEFANEEEKTVILQKYEEEKEENPYQLNYLNKIKLINDIAIDIILLKNGNILIINNDKNIKICDNKLETTKLETINFFVIVGIVNIFLRIQIKKVIFYIVSQMTKF